MRPRSRRWSRRASRTRSGSDRRYIASRPTWLIRTQELCAAIARDFDGDASRVWTEAKDGRDLERRLLSLPGIGEMKARTLIAILGKRLGVQPPGWQEVAPQHMTLGDVDSPAKLAEYQAGKRAYKAQLRAAEAETNAEAAEAEEAAG